MIEQTSYNFLPVIGEESKIINSSQAPGSIYFTTDTRKIYLDWDKEGTNKLLIGGHGNLYYGTMKPLSPPVDGQTEFIFDIVDHIVGNNIQDANVLIPGVNDLILNSDGCFYKVLQINADNTLTAEKLTIAGSGGGGGGSASGDPNSLAGMGVSRLRANNGNTVLYQKSCPISFAVKVTDDLGDAFTGAVGIYDIYINNVKKLSGAVQGCTVDTALKDFGNVDLNTIPEDQLMVVDVGPYLPLDNNITVKVSVTSSSGYTSTRSINISVTNMELKWEYDETVVNFWTESQSSLNLSWEVRGNLEKITHIIIDDNYDNEITIKGSQTEFDTDIGFTAYNLQHGAHKFEMYVTATLGGYTVATDSIIKNIIIAKENSTSTIISFGLFEKDLVQYNTIQIPIVIYDPKNSAGNAQVKLIENQEEKDVWENVNNQTIEYWSYTPTTPGITVLGVQCNGILATRTINITSLNIEINEIQNYAFKFKASEFSSNTNVQNWKSNGVTATFSEKFDWRNGGLKTELDENKIPRQFLCIKAGSTMTINYNAFKIDARYGKCLKVIFKATKCKDYDAQILNCHDGSNGLILKAQNAIFNYAGKTLTVPYCEDEYIEFELDITKDAGGEEFKKRYIRPWLDGVPAGVSLYDTNDAIAIADETTITIGSADCDVYLYMVKLYEASLTDNNHLDNFIADAPNATEMVARFNRNNIVNKDSGEISYTLLAEKNPDCQIHLYEMDRMTKNKKDPVPNCKYSQYKGSKDAILTAEGVTVKVQGTSSEAYGLAAFNLDSKFTQGFTDNLISGDNKHIDKWSMSPTAIPVNYFCTKVNVASSEGTNNAINQDWYNKFQPYQTVARGRKIGPHNTARDCMEFAPGVVFIKDNNPQTDDTKYGGKGDNVFKDTPGYCGTTDENGKLLTSSYHKMYAIGCMGNSKKNIEVFHDLENPYECCVENKDNQYPGQWMTDVQGGYSIDTTFYSVSISSMNAEDSTLCPDGKYRDNRTLWENAMDHTYEFRYPDGIEDVKELNPKYAEAMIKGWYDFVYWMAHSNPQPAYERVILTEDQFNNREEDLYQWKDSDHSDYVLVEKDTPFDPEHVPIERDDSWTDEQWQTAQEENLLKAYFKKTEHVFGATNKKLSSVQSFSPYKFQGYLAPDVINGEQLNLRQYQNGYTPVLRGLTITDYANDYTHDTYEYRMAKMLSECENYLCMDSVVYHYLFIERHSMVDNVAKNTFWSTEDGKVWNLTKNYDNDTSDGNDNQGTLSLRYGFEPGDIDENGVSIFNAGQSVWMTFIKGLYPACQKMYNHLDSLGAWNSTDYLAEHKKWQKAIPERCWIEDYYRKYLRPYEIYNDQMFLPMHEGGQKTHQRAQYERYQDYYISSKYFGSTCKANDFILRGEDDSGNVLQDITNVELPVTLYADCYIRGAYGTGRENPNVSKRCKRNTAYTIVSPISNIGDATIYLWPSNLYQSLGEVEVGLNNYGLTQFTSSNAKKLRTLALGIYDNTEKAENNTLKQVSFTGNENLENLYIAEYASVENLNLASALSLLNIDGRDSGFKSITLPDNAPIKTIKLNNPQTLTMSNLTDVLTFDMQSYNDLKTIVCDNVDLSAAINTQNIVDQASSLEYYRLKNVIWSKDMDEAIDQDDLTILTLEKLLTKKPAIIIREQNLSQQDSLTGSLIITNFTKEPEDALDIYNKYAELKPNKYEKVLYHNEETFVRDTHIKYWINEDGEYESINSYDPMKTYYVLGEAAEYPNLDIIFKYSSGDPVLHTIYIHDGDGNVFWKRKSLAETTITAEFLRTGPNGSFSIDQLYKSPTAESRYEFTNSWIIKDENGERTFNNSSLVNLAVKGNAHLYPQFKTIPQIYTVKVSSIHPKTNVETTWYSSTHTYGTKLSEITDTLAPYIIDDDLDIFQGYSLKGYTLVPGSTTKISENAIVTDDINLYCIFELVDNMREHPSPEAWFTCNDDGVASPNRPIGGKITIPNVINDKTVTSLANFVPNFLQVTHIFLQNDNILTTVESECFYVNKDKHERTYKLVYFDFENATSLTTVGYKAFCGLQKLLTYDLTKTKLTTIGEQAFNASFALQSTDISSPNVIKLPDTVTSFGTNAFAYNFYISPQSVVELPSAIIQIEIGCNDQGINTNNFNLSKQGDTVFASYKEWNPLTLKINVDSLNNVNSYVEWLSENIPTESSNIIIKNGSGEPIYSGPGKKEEQT